MLLNKLEKSILLTISSVFIVWSLLYISRSSIIAIDGRRYYPLFDDALISMRYAWNLGHGFGLVWNPGELVEGYTNLLMTLVMAIPTLFLDKSNAVLVVKVFGIGLMLGIAYMSMMLSDKLIVKYAPTQPGLIRILVFASVLAYYPLVLLTYNGMETGLLTLLLLMGIFFALSYINFPKPFFLFALSATTGLTFLTRNDSLLFTFFIWFYVLWQSAESKTLEKSKIDILSAITVSGMFILGQELFRYYYYGELLPNTYFLKLTGMPIITRIQNGIGFIQPFITTTGLLLIIVIFDGIFNFKKEKVFFLSIIGMAIIYQVYIGGDEWRFWRFISPAIPLVFILFVMTLDAFAKRIMEFGKIVFSSERETIFRNKYLLHIITIALVFAGLMLPNFSLAPEILLMRKPYDDGFNVFIEQAIVINQLTTENATIGVVAAGTIPYFTGRNAIDYLGVNDPYIARLPADLSGKYSYSGMKSVPGHNKSDLNYSIKTLQPTYTQVVSWGSQDLSNWIDQVYQYVEYQGIFVLLKSKSADVLWDKVAP